VYIAGRGRSGTTLLSALLGNHPEICAVGELANLSLQCYRDENTRWQGLCGCGSRPFDCEFWSKIIESIKTEYGCDLKESPFSWRISDVGIEEEYRSAAKRKVPIAWLRNKIWRTFRQLQYSDVPFLSSLSKIYTPQRIWITNRQFVASRIADVSDCPVVIDISKDYLGMRDVNDYASLPTKIIFITRDCRGNIWSRVRKESDSVDRPRVLVRCAKNWVRVNRSILNRLKAVSDRDWLHIRYEDLCRDSEGTMKEVIKFIGLEYFSDILEFRDDVQHTIAGNRIRFSGKTTEIREDFAWKSNLTVDELRTIEEICGPLAAELGYSLK